MEIIYKEEEYKPGWYRGKTIAYLDGRIIGQWWPAYGSIGARGYCGDGEPGSLVYVGKRAWKRLIVEYARMLQEV